MPRLSLATRKLARRKKYIAALFFWSSIMQLVNLFWFIVLSTVINDEGSADMIQDTEGEETNSYTNNGIGTTVEDNLYDFDSYHSFANVQSRKSDGVHSQKKKKRKRSNGNVLVIADIKDATSIIASEIAKASQIFAKAIGVDAEISEKRQKINSEIRKMPNLTVGEVIKAVCCIAQSHELIDVFFGMTEEGKEQLVNAIINGDV